MRSFSILAEWMLISWKIILFSAISRINFVLVLNHIWKKWKVLIFHNMIICSNELNLKQCHIADVRRITIRPSRSKCSQRKEPFFKKFDSMIGVKMILRTEALYYARPNAYLNDITRPVNIDWDLWNIFPHG